MLVVNRVVIPQEQIDQESARVEVRGVDERLDAAARSLAIRELLRQRAEALGIEAEEDVDAAVDTVIDREVAIPEIDEAACRRYFEANPERFTTPVLAEVRHILVSAPPDDVDVRARAEQRAEELLAEVRAQPERFAELAGTWSACPSAGSGGHLGAIGRGQTVTEFEDVVLRQPVGLAGRAVESRYGFHVVEVLAREGGEPLAYEDVRHLVAEYIRERSWRRAISQYIGQLAGDAEIEGVDLEVAESPLVQ